MILALGVGTGRLPFLASPSSSASASADDMARNLGRGPSSIIGGTGFRGPGRAKRCPRTPRVLVARPLRAGIRTGPARPDTATRIGPTRRVSAGRGDGRLDHVTVSTTATSNAPRPRDDGADRRRRAPNRSPADSRWTKQLILTGRAKTALAAEHRERWARNSFLVETVIRERIFTVVIVQIGEIVAPATGDGGMATRFAAQHLARTSAR